MQGEHIDRLERRVGHVERELSVHSAQLARNSEAIQNMQQQSTERLQYIREQFEESKRRDEAILSEIAGKAGARKWAISLALSIAMAFIVGVNYIYIEPIVESVKTMERRILNVERDLRSVDTSSEPK